MKWPFALLVAALVLAAGLTASTAPTAAAPTAQGMSVTEDMDFDWVVDTTFGDPHESLHYLVKSWNGEDVATTTFLVVRGRNWVDVVTRRIKGHLWVMYGDFNAVMDRAREMWVQDGSRAYRYVVGANVPDWNTPPPFWRVRAGQFTQDPIEVPGADWDESGFTFADTTHGRLDERRWEYFQGWRDNVDQLTHAVVAPCSSLTASPLQGSFWKVTFPASSLGRFFARVVQMDYDVIQTHTRTPQITKLYVGPGTPPVGYSTEMPPGFTATVRTCPGGQQPPRSVEPTPPAPQWRHYYLPFVLTATGG